MALATLLLIVPVLAQAKPAKKPNAALTCLWTGSDGKRIPLPSKGGLRIETPLSCLLTVTSVVEDVKFNVRVWTTYKTYDDQGKPAGVALGQTREGEAWYFSDDISPFRFELKPGGGGENDEAGDFQTCIDFTVNGELRDTEGKVVWKKSFPVKANCPD